MGRFSSTGLPFLVLRPDAGQFTYQRSIPADVVALVAGATPSGDNAFKLKLAERTLAGVLTEAKG